MATTSMEVPDSCRYCLTVDHQHAIWCPFADGEPDYMDEYVDPYDVDRAQDRYDSRVYGEVDR